MATILDRNGNAPLLVGAEHAGYFPQRPSNMTIKHLTYGILTIIDHNNHPVRHYRDMPRVISSEIEAWRIEGFQRTVGVSIPE